MIFGRKRSAADKSEPDEPVADVEESPPVDEAASHREKVGPWDAAERSVDTDEPHIVDLGGLIITARRDLELRLQTDQASGAVASAMLADQGSAVELRAFAASRGGGIWHEVRQEISADAANRGGTATEADGDYGPELRITVPVRTPDGHSATQTSRIVGIEGPRWLLRATYLGRAATEPDPDSDLESAVRDVVVVRGDQAMPPREQIPLQMPPDAQLDQEGTADA